MCFVFSFATALFNGEPPKAVAVAGLGVGDADALGGGVGWRGGAVVLDPKAAGGGEVFLVEGSVNEESKRGCSKVWGLSRPKKD